MQGATLERASARDDKGKASSRAKGRIASLLSERLKVYLSTRHHTRKKHGPLAFCFSFQCLDSSSTTKLCLCRLIDRLLCGAVRCRAMKKRVSAAVVDQRRAKKTNERRSRFRHVLSSDRSLKKKKTTTTTTNQYCYMHPSSSSLPMMGSSSSSSPAEATRSKYTRR